MIAAYRDDLAYIHDAGFGGFAREAGFGPGRRAQGERAFTEGLVLDLGCGSGILSAVVAAPGIALLGSTSLKHDCPGPQARAARRVSGGVSALGQLAALCGGGGGWRVLELPFRSSQYEAESHKAVPAHPHCA